MPEEERSGKSVDLDIVVPPENTIEENAAEKAKLEAQAEIAKAAEAAQIARGSVAVTPSYDRTFVIS